MVKTKKIQIKDLVIGMKIKTKNEQGDILFKAVTNKWDTIVKTEHLHYEAWIKTLKHFVNEEFHISKNFFLSNLLIPVEAT